MWLVNHALASDPVLFSYALMGDQAYFTTLDYASHRADMRIACECGRIINVPFQNVFAMFGGIPQHVDRAKRRLVCKRCFKKGAATISPVPTVRR